MPVTRSKVQQTLDFKPRKARTSRRASHVMKLSEAKNDTEVKTKRSKSTSAVRRGRKCSEASDSPSRNEQVQNVQPSSPRKRAHPRDLDKENEFERRLSVCSPVKIPKSPLKAANSKADSTSSSDVIDSLLSSPIRRLSLHKNESECYNKVKQSFHTCLPERLVCRDKEVQTIQSFLHQHIIKNKPGSLYISGAPGTGKTACLKYILEQDKKLKSRDIQSVFVNCMTVPQSQGIYNKILRDLGNGSKAGSAKEAKKQLQKLLTSEGNTVLLVLDEIDHLNCKGQEVLYTLFEWPALQNSRLVLVGIANALDLTDRILPRLLARPRCAPKLLNFAPYSKDQIVMILQDRLQGSTDQVMEPFAVQLCARKVAAVAGDIRKALDVCRRAIEVVESEVRSQRLLKPVSPSKSPAKSSPKKSTPKKVGPQTISKVLSEVYGSSLTSSGQSQSFPLQQKIAICTLLLLVKEGVMKEITLGKLHETYGKVCRWKQVPAVDQSEFFSVLELIETRGIVGLKKSKDSRLSKVSLRLNENDVELALQDKVFMSSILERGLANFKK